MITVIIPNLHSPVIGEVIAALRCQTAQALIEQIIVVGQDRHGQVQPDALIHFIETPEPVAAAVARNHGLAQAITPLVLFIDADCIATPTLVERLVAAYQAGHSVIGGALALPPCNYWSLSDHLVSFTSFLPSVTAGPRSYLLTANLLMERTLLVKMGGFNEHFDGAAGEDVDLSLRLRQHGIALYFDSRAVVTHRSSRQSLTSSMRHLARYGRAHATLRQHYSDLYPTPALLLLLLRWPVLLLLGLPFAGGVRTLAMIRQHPFLWRYWYVWPAIALQQMAWCWGLATQLRRST